MVLKIRLGVGDSGNSVLRGLARLDEGVEVVGGVVKYGRHEGHDYVMEVESNGGNFTRMVQRDRRRTSPDGQGVPPPRNTDLVR